MTVAQGAAMQPVSLLQLQQMGRSPVLPLAVRVKAAPEGDSRVLTVKQWLRVLPGKRYVARAECEGREVLVKLFVGARAEKKLEQEVRGYQLLKDAQLPTPTLLDRGLQPQGGWVLFDFLAGAQTLSDCSELTVEGLSLKPIPLEPLAGVVALIARLHKAGLVQNDIHPDNLLLSDGGWWLVDTAAIEALPRQKAATGSEKLADNLALFLAQLPRQWLPAVFAYYGREVTWPLDEARLKARVSHWRGWRARDLAAKSLRDSTLFQVVKSSDSFKAVWRSEADGLLPAMDDLDSLIVAGKPLKQGGSSTVALAEIAGRQVVIKRYNLKNWRHRLSRCWRPTRASHSWQSGHILRVLGVNTPKPLAMMEERKGPLRGRGYLITEYCPGQDIISAFADLTDEQAEQPAELLASLLQVLVEHRVSHGDLKGSNILWQPESGLSEGNSAKTELSQGQLSLIDLDAVCWHQRAAKWGRAFKKDIDRLLRNYDAQSAIHRRLSQLFKQSLQ